VGSKAAAYRAGAAGELKMQNAKLKMNGNAIRMIHHKGHKGTKVTKNGKKIFLPF
jgi:hypothetical protein